MRAALDTNVLVYLEGVSDSAKRNEVYGVLNRMHRHTVLLPVQVLGELFNVLSRTGRFAPAEVRSKVIAWCDDYELIDTSPIVMVAAIELAATHRLQIWDAVILAAAVSAECRLLLSEDLQDGFVWRGLTVANPFAAIKHPLLAGILAD